VAIIRERQIQRGIKPGISIPTGNDEKGLGAGRLGGHLFLIASQELGSWAFHGNLGYIRNENKVDERKDIWHASFAATWEVIKNLKLVADVGIERNPDEDANNDPAFIIGGIIYSINENFDVDLGVKGGLSKSETDFSMMAGVTLRF
jgi:Putative MetA-pathway of phenol degradation